MFAGLAYNRFSIKEAKAFLEYQNQTGGNIYRELAYIGLEDSRRFLIWNTGTSILGNPTGSMARDKTQSHGSF